MFKIPTSKQIGETVNGETVDSLRSSNDEDLVGWSLQMEANEARLYEDVGGGTARGRGGPHASVNRTTVNSQSKANGKRLPVKPQKPQHRNMRFTSPRHDGRLHGLRGQQSTVNASMVNAEDTRQEAASRGRNRGRGALHVDIPQNYDRADQTGRNSPADEAHVYSPLRARTTASKTQEHHQHHQQPQRQQPQQQSQEQHQDDGASRQNSFQRVGVQSYMAQDDQSNAADNVTQASDSLLSGRSSLDLSMMLMDPGDHSFFVLGIFSSRKFKFTLQSRCDGAARR
jgi:hypothetical protein